MCIYIYIKYMVVLVHKTTDKYLYQSESWVLKVTDDKTSEMLLSSDVVWLRGADAMLSSVQQVSYNNDLILQGKKLWNSWQILCKLTSRKIEDKE